MSWNEAVSYWILVSYAAMVLISTVFSREVMSERSISYVPFSSYYDWIQNSNMDLLWENLYNIIMFIPFGLLLYEKWNIKILCSISLLFSISIEVLQLIYCKGTCEFDDIINNTIGCGIGLGLAFFLKSIYGRIKSKGRRGRIS